MVGIPDHPPLRHLRVANLNDVMRLGIVATAGFIYASLFRWERPYHFQYPSDTILSYRLGFKAAIENKSGIVLVVEDEYKSDENASTNAIILEDNGWKAPEAGTKVVVGVMVLRLEKGSKRKGQLDDRTGTCPKLPECQDRDVNQRHHESWSKLEGEALQRNFANDSELKMLVVHPAYWRKGHGTKLVKWSQRLAHVDHTRQGLSASDMGEKLYVKLGYKLLERVSQPGDDDDPKGVSTGLLVYTPEGAV